MAILPGKEMHIVKRHGTTVCIMESFTIWPPRAAEIVVANDVDVSGIVGNSIRVVGNVA